MGLIKWIKELVVLQEFLTIPTSFLEMLPPDKFYALADILSMADANLVVHTSVRKLMNRWGWSNTKVVNFIKFLDQQDVLKTLERREKDTKKDARKYDFLLVNQWFLGCMKDTKKDTQKDTLKTLERREEDTQKRIIESKKEQFSIKYTIDRITDSWNALSQYGILSIPATGISSAQYQNILLLLEEYNVETILQAIEKVRYSDFLKGKSKYGWKIYFDWFVKTENFEKIIKGNYDNRREYEYGTRREIKKYDDRIGTIKPMQ